MDNRYYDSVIKELQPFLTENGFSGSEDGSFANEQCKVKVCYDESRQVYTLNKADKVEDKFDDFKEITAWLFDDSQNEKDAESVGIGFTTALKNALGIKPTRVLVNGNNVALPTANKSGNITIGGFTKKLLDIFPNLKEEYKAHVANNGDYLYLHFFGESVVAPLKVLLLEKNKKQVKKIVDLFEDIYVQGDKEAVNAELILLCATAYNNDDIKATVLEAFSADTHFCLAFDSLYKSFASNKKLQKVLVK